MANLGSSRIEALRQFMEPKKKEPDVPSSFTLSESQFEFLYKLKEDSPILLTGDEKITIERILAKQKYSKEEKKMLMDVRRRYKKHKDQYG